MVVIRSAGTAAVVGEHPIAGAGAVIGDHNKCRCRCRFLCRCGLFVILTSACDSALVHVSVLVLVGMSLSVLQVTASVFTLDFSSYNRLFWINGEKNKKKKVKQHAKRKNTYNWYKKDKIKCSKKTTRIVCLS